MNDGHDREDPGSPGSSGGPEGGPEPAAAEGPARDPSAPPQAPSAPPHEPLAAPLQDDETPRPASPGAARRYRAGDRSPEDLLEDVLSSLRARALRRSALFAAAAFVAGGVALVLVGSLALGLGVGTWARGLTFGALGLGLLAAAAFVVVEARRRRDAALARALEQGDPAATGLSTAVELVAALRTHGEKPEGAPFSVELARAHVEHAASKAWLADPERAFPRKPLRRALAVAFASLSLLVLAGLAVKPVGRGLSRLWEREAVAVAGELAPGATPITGEIELVYVYPAHTGLPPKTVQGTSGEITAPRGTEVKLRTRADRDVAKAYVELDGSSLPLEIEGRRGLSGAVTVQKTSRYSFRFEDASGDVLAVGPPIPITVVEDGAPQVRITAPVPELVVSERDTVELAYEASDDHGVASLELVYKVGGGDEEVLALPGPQAPVRRFDGAFPLELAPLGLRPGDEVSYYVRAADNDGVLGAKRGQSRTQKLKVFSEAEHRRELLAKVEQAWEKMVAATGDRIAPREGPRQVELRGRVAAGKPADEQVSNLAVELSAISGELRKDKQAPRELAAATTNISAELLEKGRLTRIARSVAEKSASAAQGPLLRLDGAEGKEQRALENNVLYLEALLDRQRMEEMRALAREMADSRRELARLLEEYRTAPTDQVKSRIQQEVARLKARMNELMRKMAELGKGIRDEHLNQEAMEQLEKEQDLMGQLDEVQKLLAEGKIDEAMKKLQELGMQLDELEKELAEAQDGQAENDPAMKELAEQLEKYEQELAALEKDQQKLGEETDQLRREYRKQIQKELEQKGKNAIDELRKKTEKAREAVADVPAELVPFQSTQNLGGAQERLEDLENALAAKELDAALEAAARALAHGQALAGDLERETEYARRFGDAVDPRADRASRDARKAAELTDEVKKKLEELFPDPEKRMSQGQKAEMQRLAQKQQQLEQRMGQLREQAEQIGQKAPIFDPKAQGAMQGASESMAEAQERLRGRDPGGALASERRAEEQLEQLQQGLEETKKQAGKNRGGQGFPLPFAMRGSQGEEDGDSGEFDPNRKVLIPGADQYKVSDEFRKDILEAMKQGSPEAFKEHVKEYYEEIVK